MLCLIKKASLLSPPVTKIQNKMYTDCCSLKFFIERYTGWYACLRWFKKVNTCIEKHVVTYFNKQGCI